MQLNMVCFHWGPIAWAIYATSFANRLFSFVKKKPVYKIQACRPILKGHTDKLLGKIVDILFIFGLLGGAATSLALGVPMISAGIERLTGLDGSNMILRSIILLTITFSQSVLYRFEKGIQN